MNVKTTLAVEFSDGVSGVRRAAILDEFLRIDGVDTVADGTYPVVKMNETRSVQQVQKDILKIEGVRNVYSPPVSSYFVSEVPKP